MVVYCFIEIIENIKVKAHNQLLKLTFARHAILTQAVIYRKIMRSYELDGVINIIQEKKLKNIPSKGRNQWEFLKKFDGYKVIDFIESAKAETKSSPLDTFQKSNWWDREIDWNIERGNIIIRATR